MPRRRAVRGALRGDVPRTPLTSAPPTFRTATTVEVGPDVTVVVGTPVRVEAQGSIDGVPVDGPVALEAGRHALAAGTRLAFPAGAHVPHAEGTPIATGAQWGQPLQGEEHPMYRTYALTLALFLGLARGLGLQQAALGGEPLLLGSPLLPGGLFQGKLLGAFTL